MKLHCLGTASGIATRTRLHNMLLLESRGHSLLLDGGEPLSTQLIRYDVDLNRIDGMVISHLHPDHAGALPQLIQTFQISGRTAPFKVLLPAEGLPGYPNMLNMLYLFDRVLPFRLAFEPIHCSGEQRIGDFALEFQENDHLKRLAGFAAQSGLKNQGQSYCSVINAEEKRVVYSGDIKSALELLPLLKRPAELLILEMAHFNPDELLTLFREAPPKRAVLTHFHPDLDVDPEKKIRNIFDGKITTEVIFAYDGIEVEI